MRLLTNGLLLISLLLALAGCDLFGEDGGEEEPSGTFLTAQVNGESWEAETASGDLSNIAGTESTTVFAENTDEQRLPYRGTLLLRLAATDPGAYSLTEKVQNEEQSLMSGSLYIEGHGDAVIAYYQPTNDSLANHLQITGYDSETGVMKGTFRTTLVVPRDYQDSPGSQHSDTLRFSDGQFRVRIDDHRER